MANDGSWITQAEAARLRGVSRSAISSLVQRGRLKTRDVGGVIFVLKRDVLKFRKRKPGPKPQK